MCKRSFNNYLCRRLGSVSLTAGSTVPSISSLNCTQASSRRHWTASFRQELLPFGDAHPTPGSTRNVARQSASSGVWNGQPVFAARRRPPLPGTLSDVSIVHFYGESANDSGVRRSTLRSRRRVNCGAPLTRCWVVAVCRLWTTSVQNSSIVTSMTRSPVFDLRRPTPHHRRSRRLPSTLHSASFIL